MEKYNETDNEYYDREFNRLEDIRSESETLKENRTFDIASGGLALSIGIFTYLSTNDRLEHKWIIISSMICLCLAIIVNYLSHYVSIGAMERNIDIVNALKTFRVPYNNDFLGMLYVTPRNTISFLNGIVLFLTIIGVVLIALYSILFIL